jgi:aspartyl/glutamyl-tRNA(Asn/Gln) amidotransferase C subunit
MDTDRIARLARLSLTPDEKRELEDHLRRILVYVRRIEDLDLKDIEPLVHPLEGSKRFRHDTPGESLDRDPLLEEAPDRYLSYYRAPSPLKTSRKTP